MYARCGIELSLPLYGHMRPTRLTSVRQRNKRYEGLAEASFLTIEGPRFD